MRPFDVEAVRAEFPALDQRVNGKPLVYLDNAATTHKPRVVIEAIDGFWERDNSNVHRGVHTLSQRATTSFEAARQTMANFVHASGPDEIVFVRGTTEALNLVANAWGGKVLRPGDRIVLSGMEHHSNIVPWQLVAERTGAEIVVMQLDADGAIADGEIERSIDAKTRIVSVVHTSNALGTVNPVRRIADAAHAVGAVCVVDGAQAVGHGGVDVAALGCDFFACSSPKMFGPTGVGLLWGRRALLADMPPWQGGGDMIKTVTFTRSTWADPPARFEAGTPAIAEAIGMAAAARWLMAFDHHAVQRHEAELLAYGTGLLSAIPGLRLIGTAPDKRAVLGFVLEGCHPHDVGMLLDHEGVAVRVGHHCTQPVMAHFGVTATTRASLSLYSTRAELDRLAAALDKVRGILA
ncbi:MAG: SufS family cysteine desulfurase [Deltaproteobacteria bacterium]|nr:SufS family cysteine desulfurase [Deltaproteobacteria bacterium]